MVSLEQLSTFSGFKKDEDYKDPVVRQHFCLNAKEWIEHAVKFCETQLKWGKRATFDGISRKLQDEADSWFQKTFSYDEKLKIKNLKGFIARFCSTYCDIPYDIDILTNPVVGQVYSQKIIVEKHTEAMCNIAKRLEALEQVSKDSSQQTISMLVDRVDTLETTVKQLNSAIASQNTAIEALKAALTYQCEKYNRVTHHSKLSQNDTMKSLKDKHKHFEQVLEEQKQEVQQAISTISVSSVTNQQFLDHKVALDKLSADLDKLSSFVDDFSSAALPSVTAVKVQQDSSSSPIGSKLPVCTRCGKRSHSEKTCGSNHLYCYICGKKGHLARCCRTKDPGSCGRCGSTDHVSHNCGAFRKGTICWLCFKPGHLYRSCNTKFKIL